jgi:hypothetical protein
VAARRGRCALLRAAAARGRARRRRERDGRDRRLVPARVQARGPEGVAGGGEEDPRPGAPRPRRRRVEGRRPAGFLRRHGGSRDRQRRAVRPGGRARARRGLSNAPQAGQLFDRAAQLRRRWKAPFRGRDGALAVEAVDPSGRVHTAKVATHPPARPPLATRFRRAVTPPVVLEAAAVALLVWGLLPGWIVTTFPAVPPYRRE